MLTQILNKSGLKHQAYCGHAIEVITAHRLHNTYNHRVYQNNINRKWHYCHGDM